MSKINRLRTLCSPIDVHQAACDNLPTRCFHTHVREKETGWNMEPQERLTMHYSIWDKCTYSGSNIVNGFEGLKRWGVAWQWQCLFVDNDVYFSLPSTSYFVLCLCELWHMIPNFQRDPTSLPPFELKYLLHLWWRRNRVLGWLKLVDFNEGCLA